MYEYYYQPHLLYYTQYMDVVKSFLYIFKKNNFLLDRMLYTGIIVIRPLWPGVYISCRYLDYIQFISNGALGTADYTSLYKVIIRKSLAPVYISLWVRGSVPIVPPQKTQSFYQFYFLTLIKPLPCQIPYQLILIDSLAIDQPVYIFFNMD